MNSRRETLRDAVSAGRMAGKYQDSDASTRRGRRGDSLRLAASAFTRLSGRSKA